MKYSVLAKFIAIVLCALCLVTCAAGVVGIILCESQELYTEGPEAWLQSELYSTGYSIAYSNALIYGAEHLGNCPREVLDYLQDTHSHGSASTDSWAVTICKDDQALLVPEQIPENAVTMDYTISCTYPAVVKNYDNAALYHDEIWTETPYGDTLQHTILAYYDGGSYDVRVHIQPEALDAFQVDLIQTLYALRYRFITALAMGLLAFAATVVYLCCAAARRPGTDLIYPVALNRIPLDLYLVITVIVCGLGCALAGELLDLLTYEGNWGMITLIILLAFAMSLTVAAFLFACAAQLKCPGGFWWRRSIVGFVLLRLWRFGKWVCRGIRAVIAMVPLVWQWLGAVVLMLGAPVAFFLFAMASWDDFWTAVWAIFFFSCLAADILLVGWWIWYMGQIIRGAAIMRRGDLDHQIPTRHMTGRFREFVMDLNSMADAARIAAQRQLKSERMKTELITNVSHDIKTPLTSIINYVDLLKKPHDDTQEAAYLEVLDRQSQRLKKLIVDLMDMSKASTGNMAVELDRVDAGEAVNQALGEFSDKLAAAGLEPVFRAPAEPVMIRADGRLLWRVLSNLLGNAVKYALPGTRLYLDLMVAQNNAVLNLKNISRDPLNVEAEELLERFVRGDASRNTEGSGLGLNIAKSLVELQQGQMHLMVDGDLFKVTIVLPLSGN